MIPQTPVLTLDHLDELSPEELGHLIHLEIRKPNVSRLFIRHLIHAGADINHRDQNGWSPLHVAAFTRDLGIVDLLLELGADITSKTKNHWTPLHSASFNGFWQMVRRLLYLGADKNALDIHGQTPWDLAHNVVYNSIPELKP